VTPTELKFAALKETKIVGLLQTPPAEMGVLATDLYAVLHAQLVADELPIWTVSEDIPSGACQPMIWMLAFMLCARLGAPDEEVARLAGLGAYGANPQSLGEKQLRRYLAAKYVSQPIATEYF
jgi:hypothetical protein